MRRGFTEGTVNIAPEYKWVTVESKPGVPYKFPDAVSPYVSSTWNGPAIYRWLVYQDSPGDMNKLYIGEAELLRRRIYHYLKPGPSQTTNIRLNALFQEERLKGYQITLDVLEFAPCSIDNVSITMDDLKDKMVRRLLENLLIVYYARSGFTVLNA